MTEQWQPTGGQPGIGRPGTEHPEFVAPGSYPPPPGYQAPPTAAYPAQPETGGFAAPPQTGAFGVPEQQPQPARAGGPRRAWIIAAIAGGVLLVVAVALMVVLIPRESGPAADFEAKSKAFRTQFDTLRKKLDADVAAAGDKLLDPTLATAKDTAGKLDDLLERYSLDVRAVAAPAPAVDERERVAKVLDAGRLIMVGIAGMFSKSQMNRLMTGVWTDFQDELRRAEAAFAKALEEE